MQADRGVAGKGQRDIAARVLGGLEADGEERQHPVGSRWFQRLDLSAENAVEAKGGAPPLEFGVGAYLGAPKAPPPPPPTVSLN